MHVCTQICVCTTVSVCGERARDKNQRFFVLFCFSTTPYLRIWGRTLLGLLVKIKCRIWGRISHSACNSMAWLDSCVGQWTLGIWLVSIILWLLQTVQMCSTMLWFYLNPGYTNLSSCVQASYSLSPTHFRHYIFFLISKAFLFFLFLNYYSLIFFYSSVIILPILPSNSSSSHSSSSPKGWMSLYPHIPIFSSPEIIIELTKPQDSVGPIEIDTYLWRSRKVTLFIDNFFSYTKASLFLSPPKLLKIQK